jgi:hypothetical protein
MPGMLRNQKNLERKRQSWDDVLTTTGMLGRKVASAINAPLEALGVNKAVEAGMKAAHIDDLIQAGMDTETAQRVMQAYGEWAKNNPRGDTNFKNFLDTLNLGIVGIAPNIAKRGINLSGRSLQTMLPGFYAGGKGGQAVATTKGLISAIPSITASMFSPKAIATERELGVTPNVQKEIREGSPDIVEGSIHGHVNALAQMGKDYKNTALYWTPVEYFSRRAESPVFDGDLIKQTVFHPVDQVPEAVQNRFIKHVQAVHNVKNPDNTKLVIREDYATTGTGALATEAREKGSRALRGLVSKPTLKIYKEAFGIKDMTATDIKKFVELSGMFVTKKVTEHADLPKNLKPGDLFKIYLKALAKKEANPDVKLPTTQQKIYDIANQHGNKTRVNKGSAETGDEHILYFSQSYNSAAKDLGGVNQFIAVDTIDNNLYSIINDGHDMLGFNPVGGSDLITIGQSAKIDLNRGISYKTSEARKNKEREKRINEKRKTHAEEIKKRFNITREKNESDTALSRRMLTLEPTVTSQDRLKASVQSGGLIAAIGAGSRSPQATAEEEQQ